jgi:hypothetical protein
MGFTLESYKTLKRDERPLIAALRYQKHVIQTRKAIFQTVSQRLSEKWFELRVEHEPDRIRRRDQPEKARFGPRNPTVGALRTFQTVSE